MQIAGSVTIKLVIHKFVCCHWVFRYLTKQFLLKERKHAPQLANHNAAKGTHLHSWPCFRLKEG